MSKIPDDIMRAATALFIEIREMQGEPSSAKIEAIAGYLCDERQRHAEVMEEVRKVLTSSDALLKRMMHVHVAPDQCKEETVAESRRWFFDNGGTLACLADQFEAIRALLSRLEEL